MSQRTQLLLRRGCLVLTQHLCPALISSYFNVKHVLKQQESVKYCLLSVVSSVRLLDLGLSQIWLRLHQVLSLSVHSLPALDLCLLSQPTFRKTTHLQTPSKWIHQLVSLSFRSSVLPNCPPNSPSLIKNC